MNIRKATIKDVESCHEILSYYAAEGVLLPRSLSELYIRLRDYFVLEDDDHGQMIKGLCGLGICWEDLAEIKSLAVSVDMQGQGLGSKLIQGCLIEAADFGLKRVFTLTYAPDFFIKQGFVEVEKSVLPHKIWTDCLKCPKFPNCDETAMIIDL